MNVPPPDDRDTLSLGDYLALIWRFKNVVILAALVAALVALGLSLLAARSYEATVTFAATQSKIGDSTEAAATGGQTPPNTAATLRPMVESLGTAAIVIKELGLGTPPGSMSPSDFLDSIIFVDEVRGTNLITVKARYSDPVTAAKIANSMADHAVETARKVSATEASHARDLIKEQLDQAQTRFETAETQYREYRQQARIESLRKDVEARLGGPQLPVFAPGSGTQSAVPLPGGRTQVSGAPVAVSVFMENQDGRGLPELLSRIAGERARLTSLEKDRQVSEAAASRANLAALEQQKAELLASHPVDAGTSALLNRLYTAESELARRQIERDLTQGIYADLAQRYQDARLQVISRSAEFVIIDPAVPADRPASRHAGRNAAAAFGIWFALAVAGVLTWDLVQRRQTTR